MPDDSWRNGYDAWKTTPPEPMGTCYRCSEPIYRADEDGWTCRECGFTLQPEPEYDPRDAYDLDDPKRWMV